MKKLNTEILESIGFEKIGEDIYNLTINSEGLALLGSNYIDAEFTLIGDDEKGFVLDGELKINTIGDLFNSIAKIMYNNGVNATYAEVNNI